jgi:hypothetical protein
MQSAVGRRGGTKQRCSFAGELWQCMGCEWLYVTHHAAAMFSEEQLDVSPAVPPAALGSCCCGSQLTAPPGPGHKQRHEISAADVDTPWLHIIAVD